MTYLSNFFNKSDADHLFECKSKVGKGYTLIGSTARKRKRKENFLDLSYVSAGKTKTITDPSKWKEV